MRTLMTQLEGRFTHHAGCNTKKPDCGCGYAGFVRYIGRKS